MKRFLAIFVSLVFATFSFNAFVQNDLGTRGSSNKIMSMLADIYTKLVELVGFTGTGIVFTLCAIGIIVAAILDKKPKETITQTEH